MTKFLYLLLCFFCLPASVLAQADSAEEARFRVIEVCGDNSEAAKQGSGRIVFSATGAGCVDGKRDGRGVLERRHEVGSLITEHHSEGQFVRGRQVGLWCFTRVESNLPAMKGGRDFTGCQVIGSGVVNGLYRKLPDGRWQFFIQGLPADPPEFAAAGALEEQSANSLAKARAGN